MGNTLEAFRKTRQAEREEEEGIEEESRVEENLETYINTAEDTEQVTRPRPGKSIPLKFAEPKTDLRRYMSTTFAPVADDYSDDDEPPKCCKRKRIRHCWPYVKPFWICFKKIRTFLCWINRIAAKPLCDDQYLLNGAIFVGTLGIFHHAVQVLFSMAKTQPILFGMYGNISEAEVELEYAMIAANSLVIISAYCLIWQTCGLFLFASPIYMLYLLYKIISRHCCSSIKDSYGGYKTGEQVFRLLYLIWSFCVVIAYTRFTKADRHGRDMFIKVRRNRLDFINKTRRHEDKRQFLNDPIRQNTVLLLADPKRPWLKQTMAAKLAERAFAENEALAELWAPQRKQHLIERELKQANPVPRTPQEPKKTHGKKTTKTVEATTETKKGGFLSFIPSFTLFRKKE